MLDDLKYIHEKDVQDALGITAKEADQLRFRYELKGNTTFGDIDNIVFTGMGGSALAALLLQSWPTVNKPFEIVRNYDLPSYVGPRTLVIASSYSGNTEETLSALEQAEAKGAQIAVLTSGGKLQAAAEAKGYALAVLPQTSQPRYAVFYSFRALVSTLQAAGQLPTDDINAALDRAADFVERAIADWLPDRPTVQNPAKQLALELIGKSIVVYGGPKTFAAAYKWKISFNENAKHVAWTNQLPEFNHNEFIGWSKQPVDKPYAVIDLRSNLEHPRVQKRFEVTERLLSGMRPAPHVVQAEGDTLAEQLFWLVTFGDFVSIYTALLSGINPAPVDLVEDFKKALDQ